MHYVPTTPLPHYPKLPSRISDQGGFSDEKKGKFKEKKSSILGLPPLPGSGYTTPGSRAGGQLPHYPTVRRTDPPFVSHAPPPPPPGSGYTTPGSRAGGRRPTPHYPAVQAHRPPFPRLLRPHPAPPGSGYTTPGSGPEKLHYPAVGHTGPLSRLSPPPPRRVLVYAASWNMKTGDPVAVHVDAIHRQRSTCR